MKNITFPIFKTKSEGAPRHFNLADPLARREYFDSKAGVEIQKIREYLKTKTFICYLLGKKNSGKGTYSKLFIEALGVSNVGHVAVGDIVRDVHEGLADGARRQELVDFLKNNYRGFHTIEEIIDVIEGRSTTTLIPTELVVALLKYEIGRRPRQAIFVDGFPRGLDQVGFSLYLKELLGYRNDPDFFAFIDVPELVIDERIKYRVICPVCKTPRSTKLLATKEVGYDDTTKQFYLMCDTPECAKARLVSKEGDELGIEPIRARLEMDEQIFTRLMSLQGVPKIYLRNSIPVSSASQTTDEYELTPEYVFSKREDGTVAVSEKPWTVADDAGVASYSLLPPAIVVSLIKQTAEVLGL